MRHSSPVTSGAVSTATDKAASSPRCPPQPTATPGSSTSSSSKSSQLSIPFLLNPSDWCSVPPQTDVGTSVSSTDVRARMSISTLLTSPSRVSKAPIRRTSSTGNIKPLSGQVMDIESSATPRASPAEPERLVPSLVTATSSNLLTSGRSPRPPQALNAFLAQHPLISLFTPLMELQRREEELMKQKQKHLLLETQTLELRKQLAELQHKIGDHTLTASTRRRSISEPQHKAIHCDEHKNRERSRKRQRSVVNEPGDSSVGEAARTRQSSEQARMDASSRKVSQEEGRRSSTERSIVFHNQRY